MILVVEDEGRLAEAVVRGLVEDGFAARAVGRAGDAVAGLDEARALVLDLGLPDADGHAVIAAARGRGSRIPILVLTARDAVDERVRALDAGADDYLVKPFAFAELVARLRALLRRDVTGRELVLRADDLEMDLLGRRVVRGGIELDL
ncbi:MAG TPA: response regulator, partial [Kofleriaceae bacterium]|nr:response regulator [Kofleriaceae bacterium]